MLSRPISITRFALTMLATFALCVAAAVALPHDPYMRYQAFQGTMFERLTWVYERTHFDPTPIDVVFIGSSRTARGAVPTLVEADLRARGSDLRVVNFSMPASGLDVRYTKARELLETRDDVRLMVISVVEALPRDGHQAFADLAATDELLTSPWIVNRRLPANLARLPVRNIELALATLAPEAYGMRAAFDPAAYPGATIDSRMFTGWTLEDELARHADPGHAEALARESRMRRREITPPLLPGSLAWVEFGVSRSYIERIAALAEAHDVKLAFLFLPFYQGYPEPIERAWLERLGPVWIADQMMDDPSHYNDAAHASDKGARLLSDWLATRILDELAADPAAAAAAP